MQLNEQIKLIETMRRSAAIKSKQANRGISSRYTWQTRARALQQVINSLEELKAHKQFTIVDDGRWIKERDTQSFT